MSEWTIDLARREGAALLKKTGIETAALDAALLLAHILGRERSWLLAHGDEALPDSERTAFRGLILRRARGECVAYLTGSKEFRGLDLKVSEAVLVPRADTETLVEAALEAAPAGLAESRVLDLCTGSGAVALALKHEKPGWKVVGVDISEAALAVARANASRLGLTVEFAQGNLFDALPAAGGRLSFALITANPPYVAAADLDTLSAEVRREPRLALDGGPDGLDIARRIVEAAPAWLLPGGVLALEASPTQMGALRQAFAAAGFSSIRVKADLGGRDRVIVGRAGSRPATQAEAPGA